VVSEGNKPGSKDGAERKKKIENEYIKQKQV
jgi:hypothetical protein